MQIHPILGRDDEREAELVLEQVRTIRQNAPKPESIAILVRSRPHLQSIIAMLARSGLPFRAIEIERLGTRPVIQDLMALTRALHHPADRVALAGPAARTLVRAAPGGPPGADGGCEG